MTNNTPNPSTLKITHNDVVNIIMCIIEVDGLEEAKSVYKQLNAVFSTLPGWKETATDIYKLFADKRKEEFQRQREEKLEELRESAPKFVMANTNKIEAKAVGKAEIDKMNVDVNSPGNNIAKVIQLGKDDEYNE